MLSFCIAFDRNTADNGRVEFLRGSRKWNRWFQPEVFGDGPNSDYERNPNYEPIPDIEADRAAYDIVARDLEPGDVVAFHAMTVHGGAGGNHTQGIRRRGYTVRYAGDDVRYDTRPATTYRCVRPCSWTAIAWRSTRTDSRLFGQHEGRGRSLRTESRGALIPARTDI